MQEINGKTRLVGVLGWPVEHTMSPPMHNREFERLGLNYVYVPWGVSPENLEQAVRGLQALGAAGANVTIPYKQKVMPFLDSISPEAELIGAVNTLKFVEGRIEGYNTDAPGFVADIEQDLPLVGKSICVVGAGGASRAVCVGACQAGAKSIVLWDTQQQMAFALAEHLQKAFGQIRVQAFPAAAEQAQREQLAQAQVVVNATPIGMHSLPGTTTPFPPEWLRPEHYVYDVIYNPEATPLLQAARKLGCRTRNGLGMLARQGAKSFSIWTGVDPDASRMEATLKSLI